jgi:CheY-like chemotaxis protein
LAEAVADAVWTALVVCGVAKARRMAVGKLRALPLRVFQAIDPFDALVRFGEVRPDVVITELKLPGGDGIELLKRIREFSDVPVVFLAASPSIASCERALLAGAQRFLEWSEGIDALARATWELLEPRTRKGGGDASLADARSRRRADLRSELERLLLECRGNIALMSERLQKDRATVTYHLKRFGLFDPKRRAAASARPQPSRASSRASVSSSSSSSAGRMTASLPSSISVDASPDSTEMV